MKENFKWEDVEAYLYPDGAPEIDSSSRAIIMAHLERCKTEYGLEFCDNCRGLVISQLLRKGLISRACH